MNSQDVLKEAYVEVLQGLDEVAQSYPSFTTVEESGDADGSIGHP